MLGPQGSGGGGAGLPGGGIAAAAQMYNHQNAAQMYESLVTRYFF